MLEAETIELRKQWKPGRVWRDGLALPEMADLPLGFFVMGEQDDDKFTNDTERPRHRVTIGHPLALGRFPVTVAQYAAFTGASFAPQESALPAIGVNWHEAVAYCEWLRARTGHGYRLPSEAEWEYACRAGGPHLFPNGDDLTPADANFYYDEAGHKVGPGRRTAAGTYPANAFGLFDMAGNVCEWVADAWRPHFSGAPEDGEPWTDGGSAPRRVLRGGAWDYLPRLLRNSWRDSLDPAVHRDNVGFRVACAILA